MDGTEPIPPRLWGGQLRVRYHDGDDETQRRAWTVDGFDAAEVIVLDEPNEAIYDRTEFSYRQRLSGSEAAALLRRLAADR